MSAVPSHASAASCSTAARVYRRRHPERTALYRLVQQHLETGLARQCDAGGAPIPRYVEREPRGYLECGILAYDHDFLLAFSCKGRGLCPSCTTRRMAETAAHLVGDVFPRVPVRQWVVTFFRRLRCFLHRDPAPRARAPPEFAAARAGPHGSPFDPSLPWDPTAAPPEPGFSFDQTLI